MQCHGCMRWPGAITGQTIERQGIPSIALCGFAEVFLDAAATEGIEIGAIAFKRAGMNPHKAILGIP